MASTPLSRKQAFSRNKPLQTNPLTAGLFFGIHCGLMKDELKNILQLLKVLYKYQTVERVYSTPYSPRLENDVEHSYVLAMLAWHIIEKEGLKLNQEKVFKYCLSHDLVEVYAGDTWTVGTAKAGRSVATKEKRENRAQERLTKTLPFFKEVHTFIEGYKKRSDPESIFVYALDKIIPNPVVSLHADKGRKSYKKLGATIEMVHASKKGKVSLHPTTDALWNVVSDLLKQQDKNTRFSPKLLFRKSLPVTLENDSPLFERCENRCACGNQTSDNIGMRMSV